MYNDLNAAINYENVYSCDPAETLGLAALDCCPAAAPHRDHEIIKHFRIAIKLGYNYIV